jgi:membrane-associated phospholipid phosphatase
VVTSPQVAWFSASSKAQQMSVRQPGTAAVLVRSALVSVAFLLVGFGIYLFFLGTALGQQLDASSFGAVIWLRTLLGPWADRLRIILIVVSAVLLLLMVVFALVRKRVRDSYIAVAICLITLAASMVLKDFLVYRPDLGDYGYAYNTFPSGHESVSMAALIGVYVLLPGTLRRPVMLIPLIILGTASALFQVAAYAHRPSDVMAGALLAGAVAAWFPGRASKVAVGWRWGLWVFIVAAAILGSLCLASWQASGYETEQQMTATAGITLCAAACVTAAFLVGAWRRTGLHPRRALSLVVPEPS